MKTLNSIILLFISIYFVSCAQEAPKTKAKISIGAISGDSFSGGLYIIGHKVPSKDLKDDFHPDERVFLTRITGESFEKELPNGFWEFGAFGWKGNSRMTGMLKCFITPRVLELNGEEVDVTLSLSEAGCNEDLFGDPETKIAQTSQPKKLAFKSCAIVGELAEENECIEGTANSFKFEFYDVNFAHPEEMHVQRQNPFLTKRCYTKDSITDLSFPAFRGFPIGVKSYTDSNCSQNERYTLLRHGFENRYANNIDRVHILDDRINILVPSDVCADPSTIHSATILPKNDATAVTAQFICNKSQFQSMSSSGTYVLARDIDFKGDNQTITDNFTGMLLGNNKKLFNFSRPLFNRLSAGTHISNLSLSQAQISNQDQTLGALASFLSQDTSSTQITLKNINLNNINISNETGSDTVYTGGLVGQVESTSTGFIEITGIDINDVNISSTRYYTGALAGKAKGYQQNNFLIEDVSVSRANITAQGYSGGVVGDFEKAAFNNGSFEGTVKGQTYIGGLAGRGTNVVINEFKSIISVNANLGCQYVGGVTGNYLYNSDHDGFISNSLVDMKLLQNDSTDGNTLCKYVGGVSGKISDGNTISKQLNIINTKVKINSDYSTADVNNTSLKNEYYGGIAGEFSNNNSSANLSNLIIDFDLQGSDGKFRGALFGKTGCAGACDLDELTHSIAIVNLRKEADELSNGDLIGENNTLALDQVLVYSKNIQAVDQLIGSPTSGNFSISGAKVNNIKQFKPNQSFITKPTSPTDSPIWNSGDLQFERALFALSGSTTLPSGIPFYKIGNSFEPLEIRSTTQWNLLADKQFLLSKSLKLMNDLDFSGIQFKPLGDGPNVNPLMFTGRLIPNSKKLRNIYFQINDNYTALGVVRNAGVFNGPKAQIGSSQDPLIVEGLEFDLNGQPATAIGSVAGTVSKADIHARVYQANIHNAGTGSGSIGGLVGYIEQEAHIADSEFNGSIDVTNANSVGGLIGSMSGDNLNFLDIHSSKVSTSRLQGNSTTTGFLIGNVTNSNQVHIKGNYINVFDTNTDTASFISNNAPAINFERNILHLNDNISAITSTSGLNPIINNQTRIDQINQQIVNDGYGLILFPREDDSIQVSLFWEFDQFCGPDGCPETFNDR